MQAWRWLGVGLLKTNQSLALSWPPFLSRLGGFDINEEWTGRLPSTTAPMTSNCSIGCNFFKFEGLQTWVIRSGESLTGNLAFVSKAEMSKILSANVGHTVKKQILATVCRINALYMIANAGSGHIGSGFSSMEMMTSILYDIHESNALPADTIFFSSKGHDSPALYANLILLGCWISATFTGSVL